MLSGTTPGNEQKFLPEPGLLADETVIRWLRGLPADLGRLTPDRLWELLAAGDSVSICPHDDDGLPGPIGVHRQDDGQTIVTTPLTGSRPMAVLSALAASILLPEVTSHVRGVWLGERGTVTQVDTVAPVSLDYMRDAVGEVTKYLRSYAMFSAARQDGSIR